MNDEQLLRYSRHILLSQMDIEGQQRLLDGHVMIIGLGGLGAPVSMYLAGSGVGHLTLVDDDVVELANLQRQIVHTHQNIGRKKVESAAEQLHALNPDIRIDMIDKRLDKPAMLAASSDVDVIVDCTDNFETRFFLNEVSRENKIPLVSGAAIRFDGQVTVYDPRQADSPCYRCLYEDKGELQSGVFAPMLAMIGGTQAAETLKLLAKIGTPLTGRLLLLDGLSMSWREIKLRPDPGCPVCSDSHHRT
jgi:molybdopterin-synthase adenylyltransferase